MSAPTPTLAGPAGTVLRQHQFTGLPMGTCIETDESSVLQFHASYPDSNTCTFRTFVALEPIADPRESDQHALIAHSVAVDSVGQWWQVSQIIDKRAMFGKLFFAEKVVRTVRGEFSKDWTPAELTPPRARAVTPPLRVMYDGRDDLWLEVLDRLPIVRENSPDYECHLFRLRMKYFSMDVQVFEDVVRRRTDGTEYMVPGLTALVTPHVDADSVVTLLPDRKRRLERFHHTRSAVRRVLGAVGFGLFGR